MSNVKKDSGMSKSNVPVSFRSAYSGRLRVLTNVSGRSMTKQSFKDECDINTIMKRYERSGILPMVDGRTPQYIDCTQYDYHEAMLTVANAKSLFQELPAHVRERFKNDPGRMLEFINDAKNRDEAITMGLVDPAAPPPPPVRVEVVQAAPAAPVAAPPVAS